MSLRGKLKKDRLDIMEDTVNKVDIEEDTVDRMDIVDRKRAVLVSVEHFDPGVLLSRRFGAARDTKRLHHLLTKMGFKVELHNDLSAKEIKQLFYNESRRPVKECFLAVLSSHGDEGCVFGADGAAVLLSQIYAQFDNEEMERKCKLFFIQACRGSSLDDGVEMDSSGGTFSQDLCLPVDSAVMFASAPGYVALRNPCGSVFLQTLCQLLEDDVHRKMELTRLMTRLCHQVAFRFQAAGRQLAGKKQMPCLMSCLTREVFPFTQPVKEGGASGISATSLVRTENGRKRTPSIS